MSLLRIHVHKKAIRTLGISESFNKRMSEKSILAGVVMRSDLLIDGFIFSYNIVGGMDSTDNIIKMYKLLKRRDINFLMLNGCIISWYNVVDLNRIFETIGIPLLCITYRKSEGLDYFFKKNFPDDWKLRCEIYHKNGPRILIELKSGHQIYTRFFGMTKNDMQTILEKYTLQGLIPEPLRISRLLARSINKTF